MNRFCRRAILKESMRVTSIRFSPRLFRCDLGNALLNAAKFSFDSRHACTLENAKIRLGEIERICKYPGSVFTPLLFTSRDDRVDRADNPTIAALYRWYVDQFRQNAAMARPVRQSHGYADTSLEPRLLDIAEFEQWLTRPWKSSSLRQTWLQTIVAGHEVEFESLLAASNAGGERFIGSPIDQSDRSAA